MTDHPQEHESLSAFIEKVEASGEDRKHAPLGYLSKEVVAHIATGVGAVSVIADRKLPTDIAIYTQQQLDDAVAEKVNQEREALMRILDLMAAEASKKSETYEEHGLEALRAGYHRDSLTYYELADLIQARKDHP